MYLTKLIKIGQKLYSPAVGEVECKNIIGNWVTSEYITHIECVDEDGCSWFFDEEGKLSGFGEVMLFPSASKRYWGDQHEPASNTNNIPVAEVKHYVFPVIAQNHKNNVIELDGCGVFDNEVDAYKFALEKANDWGWNMIVDKTELK